MAALSLHLPAYREEVSAGDAIEQIGSLNAEYCGENRLKYLQENQKNLQVFAGIGLVDVVDSKHDGLRNAHKIFWQFVHGKVVSAETVEKNWENLGEVLQLVKARARLGWSERWSLLWCRITNWSTDSYQAHLTDLLVSFAQTRLYELRIALEFSQSRRVAYDFSALDGDEQIDSGVRLISGLRLRELARGEGESPKDSAEISALNIYRRLLPFPAPVPRDFFIPEDPAVVRVDAAGKVIECSRPY